MAISKESILGMLGEVIYPELGINIVDLGLVYDVGIRDAAVTVRMTMTTPACPLHAYVSQSVEQVIHARLPEVRSVNVELVWEPPWHPTMMSPEAKHQLGWKMMNNFSLPGGNSDEPTGQGSG